MLKTDEWLLIRDLYSQGLNISEIAKETGFDRKIMSKYLQLKTLPEPQKRPMTDPQYYWLLSYVDKVISRNVFSL